jgi:hypothetical protein
MKKCGGMILQSARSDIARGEMYYLIFSSNDFAGFTEVLEDLKGVKCTIRDSWSTHVVMQSYQYLVFGQCVIKSVATVATRF